MRGGFGAQVSLVQRCLLAASAQDVENGIGAASVGDARSATTKAVGIDAHRDERRKESPEGIGDAEGSGGWIIARALS